MNDSESKRGQYQLYKEIVIRRTLTIQGDSVMMPLIDCEESVRCLRVKVSPFSLPPSLPPSLPQRLQTALITFVSL